MSYQLSRRQFLKLVGLTGAALFTGCGELDQFQPARIVPTPTPLPPPDLVLRDNIQGVARLPSRP